MSDNTVITAANARLADSQPIPTIDLDALHTYRLQRIRDQLERLNIPLCVLSNSLSLRYAADIRRFATFQARVPVLYLAVPIAGNLVLYGGLNVDEGAGHLRYDQRPGRPITIFEGGLDIAAQIELFVADMRALYAENNITDKRIAIENMSPLVSSALIADGFVVFDAQVVLEQARLIKSPEEIACMRWSIAVCEHGIRQVADTLQPGSHENELWAVLNYVNIVNDGDWADSRQLVSGTRTNPAFQESEDRVIAAGDLVAFDTDMIGPFGYCADISRTFHCGPDRPSAEQRDLYARALEHLHHNMGLLRSGTSFSELVDLSYRHPVGYRQLEIVMHGIGMSDEYPMMFAADKPGSPVHEGELAPGMVVCVEAYAGRVDGGEGVKLEEQVLIGENTIEILTTYPFEQW